MLLQSNINNTRSDVAHLIRALAEITREIDRGWPKAAPMRRKAFEARVKSLMTDVPDLPNFSHFHELSGAMPAQATNEGDIRSGFYSAYDARVANISGCRPRNRPAPKERPGPRLGELRHPVSAGFPIMVPGQVITQETIDFMRKLDVKEIHGYDANEGLKLVRPDALAKLGASHCAKKRDVKRRGGVPAK